MKNLFSTRNLTLTGIILFSALSRLFPVIPNFQPVMAMALFAGFYFEDKKNAYLVPLLSMLLSDVILHFVSQSLFGVYLGFHSTMLFVYVAFALTVFIGNYLSKNRNIKNLLVGALVSSISFFIITNFGSWLLFPMYAKSLNGLLLCYEMALPFFRYTLISTVAYSLILYTAFELAEKKIPVLVK